MKRLTIFGLSILMILMTTSVRSNPDEGMWLPMFVERLNYVDMQEMGLQLTPEEIYSINNSSMKDAIVGLSNGPTPRGFFCTGEMVSDQGLLFTNHHCGYDAIQNHSSTEHDYLTDGFWAKSFRDELPNENMSATYFVRMEDVTETIFSAVSDTMSPETRQQIIGDIRVDLEMEASEEGKYHTVVKSFYQGNEYYLFVYEVFTDVRLVGAPPSSIGKYGGDTDNWMWPRHTGDFSIFRVYTAPDGSAANYSEENIPMQPKYHLPISLKGVEKGDFAMIWGYPGGTDRYMTSYGIEYNIDTYSTVMIDVLGKNLEIMKVEMDKNQDVKIKYASLYAGYSNYWKYLIGQKRGLKNLKVADKKRAIEERFSDWYNADEKKKEEYGSVLEELENAYKQLGEVVGPFMNARLGLSGPSVIKTASSFSRLEDELRTDSEDMSMTIAMLSAMSEEGFIDFDLQTDKMLLTGLLEFYVSETPEMQQHEFIKNITKKYKGDYKNYADKVYEKSIFTNHAKIVEFLDNPKLKTLEKDPAYEFAMVADEIFNQYRGQFGMAMGMLNNGMKVFIKGLREMDPSLVAYPDANSTMRLSYGSVEDYYPSDAVHFDYITTLKGVMEKEDPSNDEFIVEPKLKELYQKKDYGRYGSDDELIVCFLTTNDITGGNSGSPVVNGDGELIGIAFDGNWEAMSGDIAFEPELQRTIVVDARYVLFVIDKFAGASRLIDEMTIVE